MGVKHFNDLLLLLHAVGLELEQSPKHSERVWGAHLLEDWRSLELLAQGAEPEPVAEHG